tara:strand:- start:9530 stop:10198 length:669 start_codon:yes stop_codon:yes gene_type:complete
MGRRPLKDGTGYLKSRIKNIVTDRTPISLNYLRTRCVGWKFPHKETIETLNEKDEYTALCTDTGRELLFNAKYYENLKRGCVGLACNQIGHEYVRQFVAKLNGEWEVFTEPTIGISSLHYFAKEGCLSLPKKKHKDIKVLRFETLSLTYLDWDDLQRGKWTWKQIHKNKGHFTEFEGEVFQHELDHLRGTLITDVHKLHKDAIKNKSVYKGVPITINNFKSY